MLKTSKDESELKDAERQEEVERCQRTKGEGGC